MVDKEQSRKRIAELVERCNDAVREGKLSQFSEADVGSKFILHIVLNYKRSLGTGNISSKILEIPAPRFDKDETKNREVISKMMDSYLKVICEKERLEKEIREVDEKVDDEVFKLYNLTDEEITLIKKSSGVY